MNIIIILVSISIVLIVYEYYKTVSLLWLIILVYPYAKKSHLDQTLDLYNKIYMVFPGYPNLKEIEVYIRSIPDGVQDSYYEDYMKNIIQELYFLKPEYESLLTQLEKKLNFLRKLFSSQ